MPIAKLKSTETFYEIYGQGESLILIHGLSGDSGAWSTFIPYIKDHFQVITFDVRGSGQTKFDGKAFSISDLADDVASLLEYLNIKNAYIVGHSMGGVIAQDFAARYSNYTKQLVILHSRIKPNLISQRFWEGVIHLRKKYKIANVDLSGIMIPWAFTESFLAKDETIELIKSMTQAHPYPQSVENFELQFNALKVFDGRSFIPKLTMPVLIVTGKDDILTPLKEMRKLAEVLPNAIYLEQECGAHCSPMEAPE